MERIAKGAARDALAKAPDLLLVWGHDVNEPLARRGKGLEVGEDAKGVWFRGEVANTGRGRDAIELIRAGVCEGCSFAFTPGEEDVEYRDGRDWFSVTQINRLFELTLTPTPAYPQTEVEARARQTQLGSNRTRAVVSAAGGGLSQHREGGFGSLPIG